MTTNNFFATIFAKYNDSEELRAYANTLVTAISEAVNARFAEIAAVNKSAEAATPKAEAKPKAKRGKTATATVPEPKPEATSKPKAKSEGNDTIIAITDTEAIKKLDLTFVKYPDSSFWALYGDTKQIKDIIRNDLGGQFCSNLKRIQEGLKGWMFKEDKVENAAKVLGLKVKVA